MGTHYNGTEKEEQSLNAFIKLTRASETINNVLAKSLTDENLTISQFGVLEALFHLGKLNQKALAEKLLKSGGNITMVIDNLEKQSLVKREVNRDDRRSMWITLTPKGRKLIKNYFPKHLSLIVKQFDILSIKEKKELARLCKKLGMVPVNDLGS